jgi:YVTN family beta-propeller protein
MATVDVGNQPSSGIYDPFNGLVYVANYGSNNVTVIGGRDQIATVDVGTGPLGEACDTENGWVFVANSGSQSVSVINGTSLVGTVPTGLDPVGPVYDPLNGFVYVSNSGTDTITIINGTTALAEIGGGLGPENGAFDAQNGYIYVPDSILSGATYTVKVVDGNRSIATVSLGGTLQPEQAIYDNATKDVYILGGGYVGVINGTSFVSSVQTGGATVSGTYDPENGGILAANPYLGLVDVIVGSSLEKAISVGNDPLYVAYDLANENAFSINFGSGNLSVISNTSVVESLRVGMNPTCAVFNVRNGFLYSLNRGSNNVTVIALGYAVSVSESGLPSLTEWWINVTGQPSRGSTSPVVSFNESFGAYNYSMGTVAKNYSAPDGVLVAPGHPISVPVLFGLIPYVVQFTETGLLANTNWSVTMDGVTRIANSTSIEFWEPNGTHAYRIGSVPGWSPGSFAGSVTVKGGAPPVIVPWLRLTYPVTFKESGLLPFTEWWVNVTRGPSTSSVGSLLSLSEPNGTYRYTVATLDKAYSSHGGSFTVNGLDVFEAIVFFAVNYTVTFAESGLPSGAGWWVNLTGGSSTFSMTESLAFEAPNGSYSYSVVTNNLNYSAPRGSLVVNGSEVSRVVTFYLVAYPVIFTETGLPSGTSWSVTFNGTTQSGNENLEFVAVRNGTYAFTVGSVGKYTPSPSFGTITVRGLPASVSISFEPPATFLGSPQEEGTVILGGSMVVAVVAGAVAILVSRRKPSPPGSAKRGGGTPPTPP